MRHLRLGAPSIKFIWRRRRKWNNKFYDVGDPVPEIERRSKIMNLWDAGYIEAIQKPEYSKKRPAVS